MKPSDVLDIFGNNQQISRKERKAEENCRTDNIFLYSFAFSAPFAGTFFLFPKMSIILKYKKPDPETIYNAYGITEDGRYLEIGYVKEKVSLYRVIHAMDMRESAKKRFKKIRRL